MDGIPALDEQTLMRTHAERASSGHSARYGPLSPSGFMTDRGRTAAWRWAIRESGLEPVYDKRVLEVGSGSGDNLLTLVKFGFLPQHLVGNDLDEQALRLARVRLPAAVRLLRGDAASLALEPESFDVTMQSMVFSSILPSEHRRRLAQLMWDLTRSGGWILWYDFTFNNPSNPNVRGVTLREVRELFPAGRVHSRRVTLAPPISRRVAPLHPSLYTAFNFFPFLRTHIICWIEKLG